jgi:lytic murein transglycosylase
MLIALAPSGSRGEPRPGDAGIDAPQVADEALLEQFAATVQSVRREAAARGIPPATLAAAFAGLLPDPLILELLQRQPEHAMAPWDYVGRLVSESRIAEGRALLATHDGMLTALEARHGVDRHVLVAIWGIESSYGNLPGTRPVVRSLATLAASDARRRAFWRKELLAVLAILDRGEADIAMLQGSWAGAMGHTQFMPTSFLEHAVDGDGDGRRDIWRSIPDALASTANYLAKFGWTPGEVWGGEVVLPTGFDYRMVSAALVRAPAIWRTLGVAAPDDRPWPGAVTAGSLLLPAGRSGPAFLLGGNFRVLLRYNNATLYALSVAHLADRLAGRPTFWRPWPTDDRPLDLAGRRELQQHLAALGFEVGEIDGIVGEATRAAVQAWQAAQGKPADGWAGENLLASLKRSRTADDGGRN